MSQFIIKSSRMWRNLKNDLQTRWNEKHVEKFFCRLIKMHFLIIWRRFDFEINAFGNVPISFHFPRSRPRNVWLFSFEHIVHIFTYHPDPHCIDRSLLTWIEVILVKTKFYQLAMKPVGTVRKVCLIFITIIVGIFKALALILSSFKSCNIIARYFFTKNYEKYFHAKYKFSALCFISFLTFAHSCFYFKIHFFL